jgi:hypothetical protein
VLGLIAGEVGHAAGCLSVAISVTMLLHGESAPGAD